MGATLKGYALYVKITSGAGGKGHPPLYLGKITHQTSANPPEQWPSIAQKPYKARMHFAPAAPDPVPVPLDHVVCSYYRNGTRSGVKPRRPGPVPE